MIRKYWKYAVLFVALITSGLVYSDFAKTIRSSEVKIGRGVNEEIRISAEQSFANPPYIRWNHISQKWEFSNNGSFAEEMGSGTGGGRVGLYHNMLEDSCWDGECDTVSGPWTYVTTQVFSEVAEVAFDLKSLSWTPTGLDTMTSALVAIPEGLYGKDCKARMFYKGGDANMEFKVTNGASDIASTPLAAQADYTAVELTFTCPSSGSLRIEVERTLASLSPEFNFDDAYIGEDFGAGGGGGGSGSGGEPVGTVVAYVGTVAPSGWLIADGSQVSRSTYSALYSVIGNSFGNGDGSTTFHLPDLRGKFIRGHDNTAGNDPNAGSRTACNTGGNTGDNVGSCQTDQYKSHTHNAQTHPSSGFGSTSMTGNNSGGISTGGVIDASGGSETRPKNVYMSYIIKYDTSAGGAGGGSEIVTHAYYPPTSLCLWQNNLSTYSIPINSNCVSIVEHYDNPNYTVDTTDNNKPDLVVNNLPAGLYKLTVVAPLKNSAGSANSGVRITDGTTTGIPHLIQNIDNNTVTMTYVVEYSTTATRTFSVELVSGGGGSAYMHLAQSGNAGQSLAFLLEKLDSGSGGGGGGITDWSTPVATTFTADTANPTKGPVVIDEITWRQVGSNYEVEIKYEQSAAGFPGIGQYIIALPAGVQIDTSVHPVITTLPSGNSPTWPKSVVGKGTTISSIASYNAYATAYDADHIKVQTDAYYPLGHDHAGFTHPVGYYLKLSFRGAGL